MNVSRGLRRIGEGLRDKPPYDLRRSESLDNNHRRSAGGTQPGRVRWRNFLRLRDRCHCQQLMTQFHGSRSLRVGHEAEVTDADETLWQYVE